MTIDNVGNPDLYPVGGPADNISDVTPTDSTQPPPSGASTISPMDRKTIEDILSMLPRPWIDLVMALNLWNNMDLMLGLASIADSGRSRDTMVSNSEAAIVLAVLDQFIKGQQELADQLRDLLNKDASNPFTVILKQFVTSQDGVNTTTTQDQYAAKTDVVASSQFLQNSPILLSPLQSVDPELLAKAYSIAEQQVIVALLDKWVTQEAQALDKFRQQDYDKNVVGLTAYQKIFHEYTESLKNGDQNLSQPVLSLLMAGLMAGSVAVATFSLDPSTGKITFDASKDSILPIGQQPIGDLVAEVGKTLGPDFASLMPQVATELAQIAAMVVIASAYWSIPGAISLATTEGAGDEKTLGNQAAKSFAVTIAQFVNREDFANFVASRLGSVVGTLTPDQQKIFLDGLRAVMLMCALAALEQSMSGTIDSATFAALLNGQIPLADGDFRISILKMLKDTLSLLPESVRRELLASFSSYLGYKPSLRSLFEPTELFLKMWNPKFVRDIPLQQSA